MVLSTVFARSMEASKRGMVFKGLLASLLVLSMGFGAAPAAAAETKNCDNPDSMENCEGGSAEYESMLGNLFSLAKMTLQYAGFVTIFAGAVLWFTARRSSERAQTGVWLLVGGFAMIVFYFGFSTFVSLLKWISQG